MSDVSHASRRELFAPTPEAARQRLAAIDPRAYARTRNALEGAVTRLSPYLTHGLLSLADVLAAARARGVREMDHKFVQELGWRAFFHHVWRHQGEAIFASLHEGPRPDALYARELPADLIEGRTGVPVIDRAVHTLLHTGWLHNHARMWLASYTVHLRGMHWRSGADWMYGHLLDGDLASNHLSWQWVAGTGSHKPYLFNADNVARYAPPDWHSPGTVIDTSYEDLDLIARGRARDAHRRESATAIQADASVSSVLPGLFTAPSPALQALAARFAAPGAASVAGQTFWLAHPWCLAEPPDAMRVAGLRVLAVLPLDLMARWPWSEARWRFVMQRLAALGDVCWIGSGEQIAAALQAVARLHGVDDLHLAPAGLPRAAARFGLRPAEQLFGDPRRGDGSACASFSQFWSRVTRHLREVDQVLHAARA